VVWVCVFLALAVLAVFGQTAGFGFIDYDDNLNVFDNPVVQQGLSAKSVVWAFTHTQVLNWIPLTTLSHMLDCQMFGLRAGGHHLVNVLWHAANAGLLFLVLRQMTGSFWRSAFVAAVFAVHPLRAESVAWVSERKDVLSVFFFLLTIGAYVRHVRRPTRARYVAVVFFYALALMSKSMVASLPFVLLLLDYWPLGRWQKPRQLPRLVAEKIPLLALAAGSCIALALVPGFLQTYHPPLFDRVGNALVAYTAYLPQMIFPRNLYIAYPLPRHGPPMWQVFLALAFLAAVTAGAVAGRQKHPYLLMGWLWYLGMLVPVMGVVQLALFPHEDRYSYLPGIGLLVAGTWAAADLTAGWKHQRVVLGSVMVAAIGALSVCGYIQTSYWKDTETLWNHALACNPENTVAHFSLANEFALHGKLDQAIAQYRLALRTDPGNPVILNSLSQVLALNDKDDTALPRYQKAVELQPGDANAHLNLADFLQKHGKMDEAIIQYHQALQIDPKDASAYNNLGKALGMKGQDAAAIAQYEKAVELQPGYADAHFNLGNRLLSQGKLDQAIAHYRKALEINPNDAQARNNLNKALQLQRVNK